MRETGSALFKQKTAGEAEGEGSKEESEIRPLIQLDLGGRLLSGQHRVRLALYSGFGCKVQGFGLWDFGLDVRFRA